MAKDSFIWQSVKNMKEIGTIFPTSEYTARRIAETLPPGGPGDVYVEFGGGEGAVTRAVLDTLRPDQHIYTFEINQVFCEGLAEIQDQRLQVINDSALEIASFSFAKKPISILSVLPLANMHQQVKRDLLGKTANALQENGQFLQLQYMNPLRPFSFMPKDFYLVGEYFDNMQKKASLRNLPPAYVYWGRKI